MQLTLRMFTSERLVDTAAERVKRFIQRFDPPRLYVFFSGGKDSTAALAAIAYAGDSIVRRCIIVYNEIVGNTHPANVRQAMRVAEKLGFTDVAVVDSPPYRRVAHAVYRAETPILLYIKAHNRYSEDFWRSVERWGVPVLRASGVRWCYNEFKEKHWRALPPVHGRRFMVVGVKTADSRWRARRWGGTGGVRAFSWCDGARCVEDVALSPVYDFTGDEVWWLLREAGLDAMLETYRLCGDSLNCVFCPLRSPAKQEAIVEKLAENSEGRILLKRAYKALSVLSPRPGTKTAEVAEAWLRLIRRVLESRGG